jgi:hypothetical protein
MQKEFFRCARRMRALADRTAARLSYATDIEALPATLVVSITGNLTAPHAGSINTARTLGSAIVEGEGGHTIVMAGCDHTCKPSSTSNC